MTIRPVYARSSPITYIKNVKTPTLIAVGERDGECPVPAVLSVLARADYAGVKTEFIIYPGEGTVFTIRNIGGIFSSALFSGCKTICLRRR